MQKFYNFKMKAKALFLDRDGVINVDKGYVSRVQDFEFCGGIFELCRFFLARDYEIFIITNQSGIARGFYSEKDFANLSEFMLESFEKQGVAIKKIYHCPHLENCECRKPKPGMIVRAGEEFDIDLANSIFIGDNLTDMQAGARAGISRLCLVCGDRDFRDAATYDKAEFKNEFGVEFMEFRDLNEILGYFELNLAKNS